MKLPHTLHRRLLPVVGALVVAPAFVTVDVGTAAAASGTQSVTFDSAGTYTWSAPAGADAAVVDLYGAGAGGKGGHVQAAIELNASSTYTVVVGGQPSSYRGGYNGGGEGGPGCSIGGCDGGGGGGATDLRVGGTGLADRMLVAGGGGGRGGISSLGGDGGGDVGRPGTDTANPATGGTQFTGGAASTASHSISARPGALGVGGRGGSGTDSTATGAYGGGGGGGGYYGGGGGVVRGGAGGSSYLPWADPLHRLANETGVNAGPGRAVITYGQAARPVIDVPTQVGVTDGLAMSRQLGLQGWPAPSVSIAGGALPTGLHLSADGLISGTTTEQGSFPVTIAAANLAGTSIATTTVVVLQGPPAHLAVSGDMTAPLGGTFPQHLTATVTDAHGAPVADRVVIFSLPDAGPDGLYTGPRATFADGTSSRFVTTSAAGVADAGVLTANGVRGSYPAHVETALQIAGESFTGSADVTLTNGASTVAAGLVGATLPAGGVGEPYTRAVAVTGDPAPVVTVSGGIVPPGLSVGSAGRITGTPTIAGTFAFTLSADNQVGAPATASYRITVRVLPTISVGAARRLEGNTGSSMLRVPLRLSRASTVPVTVSWSTMDGTARSSDYQPGGGSVTIPAGATSATVPVTVYGDRTKEADETLTVLLSRPTGAVISSTVPVQTIANDD